MKKTLQIVSQIVFLALFIVLIVMNKIQLWMGIFGISVILTLLFGRFYCGYICPMNTVFRFITFIKKKLKIKSFKVPKFLTKPIVRYIVLAIFVGIFAFTMISGKKLPVLPALFVLSIIITLFFPESFWHNHICPYGTILNLTGKKSLYSLQIKNENCAKCGLCKTVCPTDAITKEEEEYKIDKSDCILCGKCVNKCPKDTIKYEKGGEK